MSFDQNKHTVFHIRQGRHKNWEVIDERLERPLAFFTKIEHAKEYANTNGDTKEEARVLLDE